MSVSTAGTMHDVGEVHRATLTAGRLSADVLTHGARLVSIRLDGGPNMAVAAPQLDDYAHNFVHNGPVITPVANRIANASAEIDGRAYAFDPNQSDRHTLHSGSAGTQRKIWSIAEATDSFVTLEIALADGDGGFPGNRKVAATYKIHGATLHLTITATTDATTLFNPAHHGYWNLDGTETWSGHTLEVPTDRVLAVDEDKIPTGEVAKVSGDLNLRSAAEPAASIDHNFCFESKGLRARLASPEGRVMEVYSDAPGLQVYTGNAAGIALEPQHWPDAPHHPAFPPILLRPGDTFTQTTRFVFSAA